MVLVLFKRDCIISYWDILCNYCIIVTILIRTIVEKNLQLRPNLKWIYKMRKNAELSGYRQFIIKCSMYEGMP